MKALQSLNKREYRVVADGEFKGTVVRRILALSPEWVLVRTKGRNGEDNHLLTITEKEVNDSYLGRDNG